MPKFGFQIAFGRASAGGDEPSAKRRSPHVSREKITDHAAELGKESHHGKARHICHSKTRGSRRGTAHRQANGSTDRQTYGASCCQTNGKAYGKSWRPANSKTDGQADSSTDCEIDSPSQYVTIGSLRNQSGRALARPLFV